MIHSYSNQHQCILGTKLKFLLSIANKRQFLLVCEHCQKWKKWEGKELSMVPSVICYAWSFREHPTTVITYVVTDGELQLEFNSTVQKRPHAYLLLLSELPLIFKEHSPMKHSLYKYLFRDSYHV